MKWFAYVCWTIAVLAALVALLLRPFVLLEIVPMTIQESTEVSRFALYLTILASTTGFLAYVGHACMVVIGRRDQGEAP